MTSPQDRDASTVGIATQLEAALRPILRGPLPVRLRAWDGSSTGSPGGPTAVIASPDALRRILWAPGELGAAQAYVTGEIDVEGDVGEALDRARAVSADRRLPPVTARSIVRLLPELVRLARAYDVLGRPLPAPASQARLRGRVHTLSRDREAIRHHYDLSNAFYELVLDPHMAYSSAYFSHPDQPLEEAQAAKLDLVCRKVGLDRLGPGARLLDLGCGWGSLSLYAAEHYGAHVTGVTIAAEQKAFVDARIAERGLQDLVTIRLQDYRDVADGPYEAVASIEMGEHVGQSNYPRYVEALRDNVRPGGHVLIQQMSRRGRHPGGGPFIESFIAPDMHMRPVGETVGLIEDGGLEVRDVHAMREHYVWTVRAWHSTFEASWDTVVALVGEEVARVWRLYLVGGAQAFRDGRMGVDQVLARRPDSRPTAYPLPAGVR